ncbi:hypothetical protein KX816_09775 [Sphingosinicellaceae bacterium]|nr:hypothetical protein KX816_09775 [Sphingosinicellaceae bacterium]
MRSLKLLLVLAFVDASPALADTLHLVCRGSGVASDSDYVRTETRNHNGRTRDSRTLVDTSKSFSGELKIEITEGAGRAFLPRVFLPALSHGKDGWFDLKNLNESDNLITAKIAVGIMSKPDLRIDRLTGSITVNGSMGNFAGHCRKYDPTSSKRAF